MSLDKAVLFYHVYLRDNLDAWLDVVLEQMKIMEDSKLLENFSEVKVIAITQDDSRKYHFNTLMNSYDIENLDIEFVHNPFNTDHEMIEGLHYEETITENYTYRRIYEYCNKSVENKKICYVHTKGITRTVKLSRVTMGDMKKYYYWRQLLNWGVLKYWQTCVSALDTNDVAGVNFYSEPSPHYSGNFWWANSTYIKTLPDPKTKDWWYKIQAETKNDWLKSVHDRFRDEQWLCHKKGMKAYNLYSPEETLNPSSTVLKSKEYIK